MANRHTTRRRVSAGAALVTGLGTVGLGLFAAAPAQAAPVTGSLEYTCSVPDLGISFQDPWQVDLALPIEDQVEPGATIPAGEVSATVTPGDDATTKLQQLGTTSLEGTAETTYTFGGSEPRDVSLTVPQTDVPTSGSFSVNSTGQSTEETAPAETGTVDIVAGDFTAALENEDGFIFNISCTAPENATVGTVTVGSSDGDDGGEDPAPEANDWFTEPEWVSVSGTRVFVSGEASQDGVVNVVLLDEAHNELATYEWNVTVGENEGEFENVDGMKYVRLVSQDCVDANGDDETVAGSGCNVEFGFDDIGGGDDQSNDTGGGDDQSDDTAEDDTAEDDDAVGVDQGTGDTGTPEIPEVVQTDGGAMKDAATTNAALGLGGLVLVGAAAGSFMIRRRRAEQL